MKSILFALLLIFPLFAQEIYNTNLLVEQKIDPRIINTMISNTRQNVAYRMKMHHQLEYKAEVERFDYYLIVDPFPSYGSEMYIQIAKNDIDKVDIGSIQKKIDAYMGVQLYVQHADLFDIRSLKLEKESVDERVISFKLKEETLPRELRYIRDMTGYIYVKKGVLEKIELVNTKRFMWRGIEINEYKKTNYYERAIKGGYLISQENIAIAGMKDGLTYKEELNGTIVEYWNKNGYKISVNGTLLNEREVIENEDYTTVSVDLDRFFPLLGKEARKAGYDLPKPFGLTLVNMFQDTTMHMTSFEVDNVPIDFNKILDGDSTYRSLTYAPLIRADMWVLPFVSISMILGATDTTTDVTLVSDSGSHLLPIDPGDSIQLAPIKTNAILYGLGATVAGGMDNYFTTIDFQYMVAYTPEADVRVDIMVITPLIGYSLEEYDLRLFVGAQYQRLAQSLTFDVEVPNSGGKRLSGKIGLRSEEWAGVVGADYTFTRNWSSNLLYSQGIDRKNITLTLAYRF